MTSLSAYARYLELTQESGHALSKRGMQGSIVMLNMLRFREIANYSASPELSPEDPVSGADAFYRYVHHALPFLHQSGGELLFLGSGGSFLIGPDQERWDLIMMVRQSSVQSFFALAKNKDYLAGIGHRTAALEDSRLLPLTPFDEPGFKKGQNDGIR
ncbi:MAG: DUF1330 domain-containing protein [Pantoea sp. Morm]|uniref:DUF1330 domain-containing protein n=1 Tax=Pantoea sp. Morm TaxID=2601250 RepID=UPI001D1C16F2|nr:DUF1330 domain-containing protein [Pantoea sp. Morm]